MNIFHDPYTDPKLLSMNILSSMDPSKLAGIAPDIMVPWEKVNGSKANRHNIRVMCDLTGLSVYSKNVITACIQQESNFYPLAIGKPNSNGTKDYGICQFNDGKNAHGQAYWIGAGAHFPNTQYVLDNPQECVDLMIRQYKAGNIHMWSSYSTGAYKKFMPV